jgi:NADPH2:quinone reductase
MNNSLEALHNNQVQTRLRKRNLTAFSLKQPEGSTTMKAIVVREIGDPEVLRLEDVPTPEPGPGEVAIQVEFAGVNFTDVRNRVGDGLGTVPFTPGIEVSGVVSQTGEGVDQLQVGQRVAAFTGGHAYAEVVTAPASRVFVLPESLTGDPRAAGMLVTLPLALNVVERSARIRPGETVLLHGAAGGVGSIVGQLLRKIEGVRLFGTVSNRAKADYARRYGYGEILDYADFQLRTRELTGGVGLDVVLDPVGGELQRRSLEALAPFGRLVSYSNISREPQDLPDGEWMRAHCVGYVGLSNGYLFKLAPHLLRDLMQRGIDLVVSGEIDIDVTAVFPLAEASKAHRAFQQRSAVGKFILSV